MSDVIQYILKLKDDMSGNLKNIEKNTDNLNDTLKKMGGAVATYFAVDKIVEFGKESFKAFEEAEQNALKLATAVKVAGGSSKDLDALMQQSEDLQNKGIFSDDATQQIQTQALQFGLTANQVQKLTPIVEDFASATGQSVDSAMQSVLMASNGMMRGLKAFGINLQDTGSKSKNLEHIIGALGQKFAGSNELIANTTTAGQIEQFKNQVDDLQESIGEQLSKGLMQVLPYIKDFISVVAEGVKWLVENKTLIEGVAIAIIAYNIQTIIATASTWLLEGAMMAINVVANANPYMIMVTALILLVAYLKNAYEKSAVFRSNVDGLIAVFKSFAPILKATGELLVGAFTFNPSLITKGVADFKEGLKEVSDISGTFEKAKNKSLQLSAQKDLVDKTKATQGSTTNALKIDNTTAKSSKASASSKVTGSKNTTIQITIQKFIDGGINISTTTLKESASEMQTMIAKALLNAVNDAQLINTQ
jgi:hypothetical protein